MLCPKSTFRTTTSSVNSQSRNSTLKVTGVIGQLRGVQSERAADVFVGNQQGIVLHA